MSEDKWKVIKIKFEQTLKSWELDKKTNQFTVDSIHSLFPTEIEAIIKYIEELENNWNELKNYIQNRIYEIEPKGCGINFYCEYDSEEDYIRAMKKQSRLLTLKENLSKMKELENNNDRA